MPPKPSKTMFWEDFSIGREWEHGEVRISQDDIVSFAKDFDPLPMHLHPILAQATPMGELCASGIHTLALTQRLLCEVVLLKTSLVAGGGMQNVKFIRPVLPNDKLRLRAAVTHAWHHPKESDRGWISFQISTFRQDGTKVLTYDLNVLVMRACAEKRLAYRRVIHSNLDQSVRPTFRMRLPVM